MNRRLIAVCVILFFCLTTGCAYLQKKDEPPPLPPVETKVKPPFKLKGEHFKEFPWSELGEARKDETEPNTQIYTVREGDSLDSIAEERMGNRALASRLAEYNSLSPNASVAPGDRIVIPNPILGVSSRLLVKQKGEKEFGSPLPFDTELQKGDEYKMRFETDVNGYLYVFKQGVKGVEFLYPAKPKAAKTPKTPKGAKRTPKIEPIVSDTGKVAAHDPIEIPTDRKGLAYDVKSRGDVVFVFLSMKRIPELEGLKDKKSVREEDLQAVMHRVKVGEIVSEAPYTVIRVSDPNDILGFTLNIKG